MNEKVIKDAAPEKASMADNGQVTQVEFDTLDGGFPAMGQANLEKLLRVPLTVTIELGRRNMSVKEVLELSPGTVVELDKVAGDPVDLLVNDRPFATGEVVAYKGYYGIRITDITSQEDRFNKLL